MFSERLALPLDDELVMAQRYPVEQVTDPLANVDGGDFSVMADYPCN